MLYIQDPGYKDSTLLNDELLSAMKNARGGFATYAFVTEEGLQMLFDNEIFSEFIVRENCFFTLVMGIDEVTNERTLNKAKQLCECYSNLEICVFMELGTTTIYHPKFAAFSQETGGKLIIGSGNLTLKGLRKNREAFTVIKYSDEEYRKVIANWEAWLEENKNLLYSIDDEKVREKARENTKHHCVNIERRKKRREGEKNNVVGNTDDIAFSAEDESDSWEFSEKSRVLVMEVPRNRPGQVNFHKSTIRDFFGIDIDYFTEKEIVLRMVNENGKVGDVENRFMKYKPGSKNYYLEASAQSGISYPADGNRPIFIFAEIAVRTYLYMYLLPGNYNFEVLQKYMISQRTGNLCAQEIMDVGRLKQLSPKLRLLEYLDKYMDIV